MSDGKYYATLLVGFGAVVIGAFVALDLLQPKGLNWELVKQIVFIATPILTGLGVMMNSNKNQQKTAAGQEVIGRKADDAAQKAESTAATVSAIPDLTVSKLKRDGRPGGP